MVSIRGPSIQIWQVIQIAMQGHQSQAIVIRLQQSSSVAISGAPGRSSSVAIKRRTRAFVASLSMSARRNAFVTSTSSPAHDAPSWARRGSGAAARRLAAMAAGDLGASC